MSKKKQSDDKLQNYEVGFLSTKYAEALESFNEVSTFLSNSRDTILINALFLKLADIFDRVLHPSRMLIVKVFKHK